MLRKAVWAILAAFALVAQPSAANASAIVAGTWYEFGFDGVGTPLEACPACTPGTNAPGGAPIIFIGIDPWEITTTDLSQALIVVDGFESSDQFELFDSLVSIGETSVPIDGSSCGTDLTCALLDPDFSQGVFPLAVGAHSFTGTQIEGVPGAGFLMVSAPTAAAVPEPATLMLLGAGLLGGAIVRQRRRASARRAA